METVRIAAGILAGGKSSRMGKNKILLPYKGGSFLAHMWEQCVIFPERLLSVADAREYEEIWPALINDIRPETAAGSQGEAESLKDVNREKPGEAFACRMVEDEKKEYGPLEGIYQLLAHTRMEYVFVLAADMPGISGEFLEAMAAAHQGEDCLVLKTSEGGIHPLCAIYAKRLLPELAGMRERGERQPRRLYKSCRVRYITAEELGFSDAVVENINTPEEYERLVRENETD